MTTQSSQGSWIVRGKRQKFTFGVWEQAEPEIVSDSLGLHVACLGPCWRKMAPSSSCHSSAHSRPALIKFWGIQAATFPQKLSKRASAMSLKLLKLLLQSVFLGSKLYSLFAEKSTFLLFLFILCFSDSLHKSPTFCFFYFRHFVSVKELICVCLTAPTCAWQFKNTCCQKAWVLSAYAIYAMLKLKTRQGNMVCSRYKLEVTGI